MSALRKGNDASRSTDFSDYMKRLVRKIGSMEFSDDKADSKEELRRMLNSATTYDAWLNSARRLDVLEGHQEWRHDPRSPYYDHKLIQDRIQEMQRLDAEDDINNIMLFLRSGLMRNLGGINDPRLFERVRTGTKNIIQEHQRLLVSLFQKVCFCDDALMPLDSRLSFFLECRHAIGKTALLLSSGISNGVSQAHHLGVIKALHERGLLPRVMSGRSTGAIAIAIVATRTRSELDEAFVQLLGGGGGGTGGGGADGDKGTAGGEGDGGGGAPVGKRIRLASFRDPDSTWDKLRRWVRTGSVFDVDRLREAIMENVGDVTFHEAYVRTGFIANILVSPASDFEHPRLLNYLTAPDVLIWSAALASCAFPGLCKASQLIAKRGDERIPYIMGHEKSPGSGSRGLELDLPFHQLKVLFNVNFFIVSQINPQAIPFVQRQKSTGFIGHVQLGIKRIIGVSIVHYIQQAIRLGIAPNFCASFVNQKYSGDTTVSPIPSIEMYRKLFFQSDEQVLIDFIRAAEQRTWIRIAKIRCNCEIEVMLERSVRFLGQEARDKTNRITGMNMPAEISQDHSMQSLVSHSSASDLLRSPSAPNAASPAEASPQPDPSAHRPFSFCAGAGASNSCENFLHGLSKFAPSKPTQVNAERSREGDADAQREGSARKTLVRQNSLSSQLEWLSPLVGFAAITDLVSLHSLVALTAAASAFVSTQVAGIVAAVLSLLFILNQLVIYFSRNVAAEAEARRLHQAIQDAKTYEEWLLIASELDEIQGWKEWREKKISAYYDSKLISDRIAEMKQLEKERNIDKIVFWLRAGMMRNLGGIGDSRLDDKALTGTKRLIEEHQEGMVRLLLKVCNCSQAEMPLENRLVFFAEASHVLGKTALLLSGGAGLGMYHFGIVRTLKRHGLLPRIISGSSAGSIVAAIVCIRTSEELDALFASGCDKICKEINLNFFDQKSVLTKIIQLLRTGYLMDCNQLRQALIDNLGSVTFHEAYKRTGIILNIPVSPGNAFEKPRLLNYITAPNVLIWSASLASCACPFLYEAVSLVAKGKSGEEVPFLFNHVKWTDGSISFDLPMNPLQELFNADYFVVCQTNPHVLPFVQGAQRSLNRPWRRAKVGLIRRCVATVTLTVKSELLFICKQISRVGQLFGLGFFPNLLAAVVHQNFVGDCTFVPPLSPSMYLQVLQNPDARALDNFMDNAEKLVWPSLAAIRRHSELQMVFNQCVRLSADEVARRAAAKHQGDNKVQEGGFRFNHRNTHIHLNADFDRQPSDHALDRSSQWPPAGQRSPAEEGPPARDHGDVTDGNGGGTFMWNQD